MKRRMDRWKKNSLSSNFTGPDPDNLSEGNYNNRRTNQFNGQDSRYPSRLGHAHFAETNSKDLGTDQGTGNHSSINDDSNNWESRTILNQFNHSSHSASSDQHADSSFGVDNGLNRDQNSPLTNDQHPSLGDNPNNNSSSGDNLFDHPNGLDNSRPDQKTLDDYRRILNHYNDEYGVNNHSQSSGAHPTSHNSLDLSSNSANSDPLGSDLFNSSIDRHSHLESSSSSSSVSPMNRLDTVFSSISAQASHDAERTTNRQSFSYNPTSAHSNGFSHSESPIQSVSSTPNFNHHHNLYHRPTPRYHGNRGNRQYNGGDSYYRQHRHLIIWSSIAVVIVILLLIGGLTFKHYQDQRNQQEAYQSSQQTMVGHRRHHAKSNSANRNQVSGRQRAQINRLVNKLYGRINKLVGSSDQAKIRQISDGSAQLSQLLAGGISNRSFSVINQRCNALKAQQQRDRIGIKSIVPKIKSVYQTKRQVQVNLNVGYQFLQRTKNAKKDRLKLISYNCKLILVKQNGQYRISKMIRQAANPAKTLKIVSRPQPARPVNRVRQQRPVR